jgi:phenylpyruvate tautomerase PptA (4-oxalocrotonate tautomerase family)
MPLVCMYTSAELPSEEGQKALLRDVSATTAQVLGKPEAYVMTRLAPRGAMTFAGSSAAACLIEVKSLGGLAGDAPGRLTGALSGIVQRSLGVPANRTFVVFTDVPGRLWGFDGSMLG